MKNFVNSLLELLGLDGQPWIAPVLLIGLFSLAWPYIHKNIDTDAGRRKLRGMSDMPLPERRKAQAEALEIVGEDPDGLIGIADEAIRQNERDYARTVLEKLKSTGKKKDHVRRLEHVLEDRTLQLPEQTVIAVERMLDAGMLNGARERLAPALKRWPDHPELQALQARIDAPDAEALAEAARNAGAGESS